MIHAAAGEVVKESGDQKDRKDRPDEREGQDLKVTREHSATLDRREGMDRKGKWVSEESLGLQDNQAQCFGPQTRLTSLVMVST